MGSIRSRSPRILDWTTFYLLEAMVTFVGAQSVRYRSNRFIQWVHRRPLIVLALSVAVNWESAARVRLSTCVVAVAYRPKARIAFALGLLPLNNTYLDSQMYLGYRLVQSPSIGPAVGPTGPVDLSLETKKDWEVRGVDGLRTALRSGRDPTGSANFKPSHGRRSSLLPSLSLLHTPPGRQY